MIWSRGISPRIIYEGIWRRFAVNFRARPLCPHINNRRYALNVRRGLREKQTQRTRKILLYL